MTQVLQDITVLDFSTGWAGSVATMVLSDFGAEVIKAEPPEGDPYRAFPQALLWNRGFTLADSSDQAMKRLRN